MSPTDVAPDAPDGGMSLSGAECQWPEHWPAHSSPRACHEGDCRRCEMEQEHGESHEGEPCPWGDLHLEDLDPQDEPYLPACGDRDCDGRCRACSAQAREDDMLERAGL